MDLADLDIFRSVVKAGGITRAAEKLNRVHPMSPRASASSNPTRRATLDPRGQTLHLSSEGKLRLDYADRLLDLAQEARERCRTPSRAVSAPRRMESTAAVRLPVPMNEYMSAIPRSRLSCEPARRATLRRRCAKESSMPPVAERSPMHPSRKSDVRRRAVIIATVNHPPIKSPKISMAARAAFDAAVLTANGWTTGSPAAARCPIASSRFRHTTRCLAARLWAWGSRCAANRPEDLPDVKLLSVHAMPAGFNIAPTVLIRRKGPVSPKVSALLEF